MRLLSALEYFTFTPTHMFFFCSPGRLVRLGLAWNAGIGGGLTFGWRGVTLDGLGAVRDRRLEMMRKTAPEIQI